MSPSEQSQDAPMPRTDAPSSETCEPGTSNAVTDDPQEICAFCLDVINDSDACSSTNCAHIAHKTCYLQWLENSRTCATCRKEVVAVKMKSGKPVRLPKLKVLAPDHPLAPDLPPLNEEEFINAYISSEEDYSDHDYYEHERVVLPTRRTTRQSGPLRMSASDRARENMIASFAQSIAVGVGSSRRGRGSSMRLGGASTTSRSTGVSTGRRRAIAPVAEVDLDEMEERLEAEGRGRPRRFNFFDDSDEEEQAMRHARPARNRVILDSDDEMGDMALPDNQPRRRTTIESNEDDSEEGSETSESGSEESGEADSEEETDSDNSELDESVLDDEPSSSARRMNPVVRKRRTVKKRKVTKRKKRTTVRKTEGGVVKKRKTKRRKSTKKAGTRKGTKRRRPDREEMSEQRQRVRAALPSLSLNGADIDPLSNDDEEEELRPAPKRARLSPPSLPVTPAVDPTDLLGSILTSQVVAHAPGRYLEQRDGKLVPRESFSRHLDRQERRGILPVDRAEVDPNAARATSSTTSERKREQPSSNGPSSTSKDAATSRTTSKKEPTSRPISSYFLPRLVPLTSSRTPLPPPPPSSNNRFTPLPPPPPPPSGNRTNGAPHAPSYSNHGSNGVKREISGTAVKQEIDSNSAPMPNRSTALPPPPPPDNRFAYRNKKENTARSTKVKQENESDDEIAVVGVRGKHRGYVEVDSQENSRRVRELLDQDRMFAIRTAVNVILIPERQAGRIDLNEHRELMTRIIARYLKRPYTEDEVKEFTRTKLANLLEEKM